MAGCIRKGVKSLTRKPLDSKGGIMKNKLIRISKITGSKFAELKDGVTTHLISGEVIPPEHVHIPTWWKRTGKSNPDGLYSIYEYTCDGGGRDNDCRIGSPAKSCMTDGLVVKDCAKYKLGKPSALISLSACLELMEE